MTSPEQNLDKHIQILLDKAENDGKIDIDIIKKAIEFGKKSHHGQYRKNGDYFFIHPVRVATKATDYNLDTNTVVSSLLHDTVEDTEGQQAKELTQQKLLQTFGQTVFDLVEALTKVIKNQHLTLLKIIELGSVDFRVILIKLLDRLDNLSDLNYLSRKKQRRICQESATIYSEIAHGLGLIEIEEELNNLIFKQLYPFAFQKISKELVNFYQERQLAIQQIVENISTHVDPDSVHSVEPEYAKPQEFLYDRQEIVKILNSIIIQTHDAMGCYKVLGNIHTNFRSVPLNIYDYISNPKANGWRGISTKVVVNGEQIQIHIVTTKFHENNRKGVLTLINEGIYHSENYREFLQLYMDVASDTIRIEDVFRRSKEKTIQTMTPAGDIIELRYGSTILDFAFMVHSKLGLKAAGGIIDRVRYPRNKILEDGMVVKVIKSSAITAEEDWINDVVMPKSRKEIIKYLHLQE